MDKQGFIYILTNYNKTSLYVGVTSDLIKRVYQHKFEVIKGFTSKYKTKDLLYYEQSNDISQAILREKKLKNWHSDWKWNLIKSKNPDLIDLASDWFDEDE